MNEHAIIAGAAAVLLLTAGSLVLIALRLRKRLARVMLTPVIAITVMVAGYGVWYINRPLPESVERTLFEGVNYRREVRPGPVIVHVVRIDLTAPGIKFFVTPHTPTRGWVLAGQTTSAFLDTHDLQLAINGDFFDPWRDYGPWDYYPHVGDGVNVNGLTASVGDIYTNGYGQGFATLYISEDNRVSFNEPAGEVYNAISGNMMLIEQGIPASVDGLNEYLTLPHPRTVIALDESGQTLLLILVDGRQPNYSVGVTIPELIEIVQVQGGYDAINLDGGGSVTLVMEAENGEPVVLNSPIHSHIPGNERPIANQLGVYARRG